MLGLTKFDNMSLEFQQVVDQEVKTQHNRGLTQPGKVKRKMSTFRVKW